MSSIFPYSQTEIYEKPHTEINELYNIANDLLRDLMKETINTNNLIKNKSLKFNRSPEINNYRRSVQNKLKEISILQDELERVPTLGKLQTDKEAKINEINDKTRQLLDEIKVLNENIEEIHSNISNEKTNIDSDLQVELNNIQNKISVTKNRNQSLLNDEFYKKYMHEKELVKKKDIYRMDLNNNKTYDTIIYNMKEDKKQKELSNNKKKF